MTAIDLNNAAAFEAATNAQSVEALQIFTTPQVVPAGRIAIEMRRRSTKENPVPREQSYRCVLVPEGLLAINAGATQSKFVTLLQTTIHELARDRFAAFIKDNEAAATIPQALLSLDNVLAFWAEVKASQRIDAATIVEWLKQSATLQTLAPAAAAVWLRELGKLAAPSYASVFTKKQAASIVAKLADADLEHPTCAFVATRCNAILSRDDTQAADF